MWAYLKAHLRKIRMFAFEGLQKTLHIAFIIHEKSIKTLFSIFVSIQKRVFCWTAKKFSREEIFPLHASTWQNYWRKALVDQENIF
jgi:hypothetical protein